MKKAIYFISLGLLLIDVVLISIYLNRNLIFKHSETNISQIEQNNNDNKMLCKTHNKTKGNK